MSIPAPDFEYGNDGPSLILVGLDGSRTSLRAAACAAGLARRQGCPMLVVYVQQVTATESMAPTGAAVMDQTLRQVAGDLEQQVRLYAAETGVAMEFRSLHGDPLTELTRLAVQSKADMVVVGSSEHAGHRIVGSLATRLVRAGKWPVLVVP